MAHYFNFLKSHKKSNCAAVILSAVASFSFPAICYAKNYHSSLFTSPGAGSNLKPHDQILRENVGEADAEREDYKLKESDSRSPNTRLHLTNDTLENIYRTQGDSFARSVKSGSGSGSSSSSSKPSAKPASQ